jgi:predicted AlkP superfamily pyrophosphatase or phosphodiesterase
MNGKLLVIDVAALGWDLLRRHEAEKLAGLSFRPIDGIFPAVTCTVQASFRTASGPGEHGMVANGLYRRDLRRAMFWEQSSALVAGERIWRGFRARGGTVGEMFWQQSMGEDVDLLLTPAPIHQHHGGMIEDCYGRPGDLYARLCSRLGRPFRLRQYWGPLASAKAGDWIADAAAAVLRDESLAPDLLLTYLPSLDYDLQRHGPGDPRAGAALRRTTAQLERMLSAARARGYETIVLGDYAIGAVTQPPALPNLALRQAGLMAVRPVKGMLYPDLHASRALAVVDHEIAHVYVRDAKDVGEVAEALRSLDGVAEIIDTRVGGGACSARCLSHPNSGELVIVAEEGSWLAYPWWTDNREAPDYAAHVDIHNKPGFDPCELFLGWPPLGTSLNLARVRGTHGRVGPGREVAVASTMDLPASVTSVLGLSRFVRALLSE